MYSTRLISRRSSLSHPWHGTEGSQQYCLLLSAVQGARVYSSVGTAKALPSTGAAMALKSVVRLIKLDTRVVRSKTFIMGLCWCYQRVGVLARASLTIAAPRRSTPHHIVVPPTANIPAATERAVSLMKRRLLRQTACPSSSALT